MTPELSRPFAVDRMGEASRVSIEPTEAERSAIAQRLGIPEVASLVCRFYLRRWEGATVQAEGSLRARVTQTCVVSNDNFESDIAEEFEIRFVPEGMESDEIDLDAPDEIPYAGAMIDLGEATTEQLALALDPFPKKPGAEIPAEAREEAETAFSALGRLRKPD
jgi:uncharacterized metal-binding protein YceD (DUF177 family)